jgi:hypothetical protein
MTLATWESGYPAACKAVYTGSNPVVASNRTSFGERLRYTAGGASEAFSNSARSQTR